MARAEKPTSRVESVSDGVQSGSRVGPWELTRQIGEGGGGHVWRARGPGGEVALKLIAPELAVEDEVRARFLREVDAIRLVQHPNIVRYLDAGDVDGELFLVMELVEGDTLETRLATVGRLPPEEVIRIGCAVAEGLDAVHAAGLVHRDVKPTNVLLCVDGSTKLIDFGIAKSTQMEMTQMTKTGHLMGTPNYMAPEQASGLRTVSARTDVWGLGATLYDAAVGHPPFGGDDPPLMAMIGRILSDDPHPMPESLPAGLRSAILRSLDKDPAKRFASVRDFAEALSQEVAIDSVTSTTPSTTVKEPPFVARKREMMTLGGALMEAAAEETAHALMVSAAPGMGKSRMLRELRAWATQRIRDARFVEVRADPLKRLSSLSLVRDALAATDVDVSALDERQRLFLGDLLGAGGFDARLDEARADGGVFSEATYDAALGLVRSWCDASPVFFLVDDLHQADEASLSMLERLLDDLADAPFVLVATTTTRATWERHARLASARRVELGALDDAVLHEIVAASSHGLSDVEIERVVARACGNPSFAVELAQLRHGEETLPPSAEASVRARLRELPAAEQRTLAHAAVLGGTFTTAALVALGVRDASQQLGHLVRGGLVTSDGGGGWAFRDRVVTKVARELLTPGERQHAHAAAAAWVRREADPNPAVLAHHLEHAGDRDGAAKQWINVVARSESRSDHYTVVDASQRALALGVGPVLEAELRVARASAFFNLARGEALEEELDLLEATDENLASDNPLRARIRTLRAMQLAPHDTELAIAKHSEAVAVADHTGNAMERVKTRQRLAALLARVDAERAMLIANSALSLAGSSVDRITVAEVHGARALAANYLGDRGLALRAFGRQVAELERAGVVDERVIKAQINWGYALSSLGALEEAVVVFETARMAAQSRGLSRTLAWVHHNLGLALARRGDTQRGMELELAAERFAVQHGVTGLAIAARLYAGAIANLCGTPDLALEKLDLALAEARALGRATVQASCHIQCGIAHNLRGDFAASVAATDAALIIRDREGGIPEFEIELWLAREAALRALGRVAEASEARAHAERLEADRLGWLEATATANR